MTEYHLAAYLTNAQSLDTAEVIYCLADQSANGEWYSTEGARIWPFWTQGISLPELTPSIEYIEYLHTEAAKFAASKPKPANDLLSKLGLLKPVQPIHRRL